MYYSDGMRRSLDETIKYQDASTESRTITYTYDELNRLVKETATETDSGYNYVYEGSYVYDLVGNRLSRFITVDNSSGSQMITTSYSYDPNTDRLLSESHSISTAAVIDLERPVYVYADSGDVRYRLAGEDEPMRLLRAYIYGLPTKLSQYIFRTIILLLPLVFLTPAFVVLIRKIRKRSAKRRRCKRC